MNSVFMTGSQVYGLPKPTSDIDLCLLVDEEEFGLLLSKRDKHVYLGTAGSDVGNRGDLPLAERDSISVRYGKLNLLLTTNPDMFEAWRSATKELEDEKFRDGPVSRDRAVEVFTKYEEIVK